MKSTPYLCAVSLEQSCRYARTIAAKQSHCCNNENTFSFPYIRIFADKIPYNFRQITVIDWISKNDVFMICSFFPLYLYLLKGLFECSYHIEQRTFTRQFLSSFTAPDVNSYKYFVPSYVKRKIEISSIKINGTFLQHFAFLLHLYSAL